MNKYSGNDNDGKPKQDYLDRLSTLDDAKLLEECKNTLWLSAYANNNPRSDFHWHCDACYDECIKRSKENIYKEAYGYHVK